jgi:hypothetical protein
MTPSAWCLVVMYPFMRCALLLMWHVIVVLWSYVVCSLKTPSLCPFPIPFCNQQAVS